MTDVSQLSDEELASQTAASQARTAAMMPPIVVEHGSNYEPPAGEVPTSSADGAPPEGFDLTAPPSDAGAGGGDAPPEGFELTAPPPPRRKSGSSGGATGDWGDPNAGLSFADKAALAAHDNIAEKELYLQKRFGEENVRREWGSGDDPDPQLVLTINDRQIYIKKDGSIVADALGAAPELAGMAAGASLGGEIGLLGGPFAPVTVPVGAAVGAGLGAASMHNLKNEAKKKAGTFAQTPEAEVHQDIKEGEYGTAAEIGGRVVAKGASKLLSSHLPDWFTGASDKSRALTGKAWAGGARPPWISMAPDARKLARIEVDAEKITGKYASQDARNQLYVLDEVRKMVEETGMPKPQVDALMEQLKDPNFTFSGREAGEIVMAAVKAQGEALEAAVKAASDAADKVMEPRFDNINTVLDSAPHGVLADDVSMLIKLAKQRFSRASSDLYDLVYKMVGDNPIVPVEEIRAAARQIISTLPKSAIPAIMKELGAMGSDLSAEDAFLLKEFGIELPKGETHISLRAAQRLRTMLRERGDADKLTRRISKAEHLHMSMVVDDAIQAAAQDPSAAPAIAALNKADEFYKNGIARFQDITVKQLYKSVKSGMPPDPEKIVEIITQRGQSARTKGIRGLVGETVWKKVQETDLKNIFKLASSRDPEGKLTVDGMKLLDILKRRGETTAAVHGKESAEGIEELAKELAARKGELTPESLAHGNIKAALQALKIQQAALDHHLKTNLLAELANPGQTGEKVYQWIVKPGEESRVMEVERQFGKYSPQMRAVQQAALEELARNANINVLTKEGNSALGDALSEFTKKQQELLFPDGLAESIRRVDETIQFIFPFKSDPSMAGFHAGGVMETPALGGAKGIRKGRLYKQAVAAILRMIALHPTFAKWVVMGRDPNTPWIRRSAKILSGMVKISTMESVPDEPDPAMEPMSGASGTY